MITIYKYQLKVDDWQEIEMPSGAEILTVQMQHDVPCVWAKVDTSKKLESYQFVTFGTGHNIVNTFKGKYVGTYQLQNGNFVFHVFLMP